MTDSALILAQVRKTSVFLNLISCVFYPSYPLPFFPRFLFLNVRILYVRYNTDANVVNGLKNSSSYETTGEKSLEIDEVYAKKIKVKVYVNQQNSVSEYTDID